MKKLFNLVTFIFLLTLPLSSQAKVEIKFYSYPDPMLSASITNTDTADATKLIHNFLFETKQSGPFHSIGFNTQDYLVDFKCFTLINDPAKDSCTLYVKITDEGRAGKTKVIFDPLYSNELKNYTPGGSIYIANLHSIAAKITNQKTAKNIYQGMLVEAKDTRFGKQKVIKLDSQDGFVRFTCNYREKQPEPYSCKIQVFNNI